MHGGVYEKVKRTDSAVDSLPVAQKPLLVTAGNSSDLVLPRFAPDQQPLSSEYNPS